MANVQQSAIIGQKFGKITILSLGEPYVRPCGKRSATLIYSCECGKVKKACSYDITSGKITSCGKCNKSNLKHGYADSPIYNIWKGIRKRCFSPKEKAYKNYGGRGITMCAEWLNDAGSFVDWAKMSGYKKGLTIDRIDNNGNYSPENCRWVSRTIQGNNKRNNVIVEYNGESMTLAEYCRKTGKIYGSCHYRITNGLSL